MSDDELSSEEKAKLESVMNEEVAKAEKAQDEKDPGEDLNKIFGKIQKKGKKEGKQELLAPVLTGTSSVNLIRVALLVGELVE